MRNPPTVLELEQAMLRAEGQFHVNGRYFADTEDAAKQRRWAAERKLREILRRRRAADRGIGSGR